MENFAAINEKLDELSSTRLAYEIKLRELELEIITYENAKTLMLYGSLDQQPNENIASKEDSQEGDNEEGINRDETPYQTNGLMFRVRKLFRKNETERRPYSLQEINVLLNLNKKEKINLGVGLSGESRRGNCFFNVPYDVNSVPIRGVYGMLEFKHLYYEAAQKPFDPKKNIKKGKKPKKQNPDINPYGLNAKLLKAYNVLEAHKQKMTIQEIMTACIFPDEDRKNFGNKIALAATAGKGFMRIGAGYYGVLIHADLYGI